MLRHFGIYNDPKKLEDSLRPLPKKGTVVKFRFLEMAHDPANPKKRHRATYQIPSLSRIKNKDGEWVDIGLIKSVDKDGNITPVFLDKQPAKDGGLMQFTVGSSAATDSEVEYYLNCSDNKTNPNRDESVEASFEEVNEEATAKERSAKRAEKKAALDRVEEMDDQEIQTALLLHGFALDGSLVEQRERVEDIAEGNPATFLTKIDGPGSRANSIFRRAVQLGILLVDHDNHRVLFASNNGEALSKMARTDIDTLANEWVLKSQSDPMIAQSLEAEVEEASGTGDGDDTNPDTAGKKPSGKKK